MAWSDPTYLKFDVSQMSSMRSKLQETSNTLQQKSKELLEAIDNLKKDWKTPAGEVFFEKFDTGWVTEVEKFVKLIDALDEILAVAETNYATVETAANSITF